jgi:phage-related minor tail protein
MLPMAMQSVQSICLMKLHCQKCTVGTRSNWLTHTSHIIDPSRDDVLKKHSLRIILKALRLKFTADASPAVKEVGGLGSAIDGVAKKAKTAGSSIGDNLFGSFLSGGAFGAAMGAVTAFTGGIQEMFEMGNQFNTALGNMQARTGATADEMDRFEEASKSAFLAGVGESVAEATNVVGNLQQRLGDVFNPQQIGRFAGQAQALATVFDDEVNNVIGKATPFIKQFGEQGEKSFNALAYAMQQGASAQDDVLDTMAEYSQIAVEGGYSAQEFAYQITEASKAGVFNTDKIGDSIKEAGLRLQGGDIRKGIEELSAELPAGLSKSLNAIVDSARRGETSLKDLLTKSAQQIEAAPISNTLKKQLQVAIAGTPAEDLGQGLYTRVFAAGLDSKKIEQEMAKAGKSINNAVGQYTSFDAIGRKLQLFITESSRTLITFADTYIAPAIGSIIEGISSLYNDMKPFLIDLGEVMVDRLGKGFELVKMAVTTTYEVIRPYIIELGVALIDHLGKGFNVIKNGATRVVSAIGYLANGLTSLFTGTQSVSVNMATLAEVAKGTWTVFLDLLDVVEPLGEFLFNNVGRAIEFVGDLLFSFSDKTVPFKKSAEELNKSTAGVKEFFGGLRIAVDSVIASIKTVGKGLDAVKDAAVSLFKGDLGGAFKNITDGFSDAGQVFDDSFNGRGFIRAIEQFSDDAGRAIDNLAEDVQSKLSENVNASELLIVIDTNEEEKLAAIEEINKQILANEEISAEERERLLAESKEKEIAILKRYEEIRTTVIEKNSNEQKKALDEENKEAIKETEKRAKKQITAREQASKKQQNALLKLQQAKVKQEKELVKLRIQSSKDGADEEIALLKLRQKEELASIQEYAKDAGIEGQKVVAEVIATINEKYGTFIADVQKKHAESALEEEKKRLQGIEEINAEILAIRINGIQDETQKRAELLDLQYEADVDRANQLADELQLSTEQREEYLTALAEDYAQKRDDIARAEAEAKLAYLDEYAEAFGAASQLFREDTIAFKALSIAQATISTYTAASKTLAAFSNIPIPGYAFIQVAATIANGLAQVANIAGVGFRLGGFGEKRGYSGDGGLNDIAGVVHKKEFVADAELTAQYRPLFEHLYRRGSLESYVLKSGMFDRLASKHQTSKQSSVVLESIAMQHAMQNDVMIQQNNAMMKTMSSMEYNLNRLADRPERQARVETNINVDAKKFVDVQTKLSRKKALG